MPHLDLFPEGNSPMEIETLSTITNYKKLRMDRMKTEELTTDTIFFTSIGLLLFFFFRRPSIEPPTRQLSRGGSWSRPGRPWPTQKRCLAYPKIYVLAGLPVTEFMS